ncbi:hypothetical protein J7T55_015006 [Diaporthe amygdali]|uniref:uncharacterized protein n=1 Tax=Phomopsis amygdali TaxID=1214568 RepID=UPI0022FDC6CE|nr:uncharacterized protein J7T55_015006 [Diaporthe amygdali]KAJ0108572.1 hypothetical protein J7T55_015006 [Diaporthe amygdali]
MSSQALRRSYYYLQDRSKDHEELIELLKNLPDQEAQFVLQKLRSGSSISAILNQVKAGDLLLQLSVSPETRFRYEFPYQLEMPGDIVIDNPYLDSLIYEAASLYSSSQCPKPSGHTKTGGITNLKSPEYRSLYLKPFHAAQVIEPRLSDARPSLWTTICDDDMLMRDLLGVFFRCEFHHAAVFQKDYFLEDMAARREDFCSSLLVNCCYSRFENRAEYWNPNTLMYRFLAEAKRIWELEATKARITTIQAGIVFNVIHNLCGLDEIGQAYRVQALALAHKLQLFDGTIDGDGQSDRTRNGRAYAAWALYNWETLCGFSFMYPPLLRKPPDQPLPDPSEDAEWYGEIWVNYPANQNLSPSYFGQIFKARSEFRVIMNEACHIAYTKGPKMTLDKAGELCSRLRSWHDGLPGPLLPKAIVLPGHLQLHMYYHNLILAIYEPLLDLKTDQNQEDSLRQIVSDASKCLLTLVRLYYLRHGYDAMDSFLVVPLVLAGFKCIDAINDQTPEPKLKDLRSTLILIAKGLYSQRHNYYLAEAVYRVVRGRMRPQEVTLLHETMNIDDGKTAGRQAMMQTVRSHWPVSIVGKDEDVDSYVLTNLVNNYAHLNIEEMPETSGSSKRARDSLPELGQD